MIQIMKNRNLILSVLFWLVASCAWAVTLPTSSYIGSTTNVDFYNDYSNNGSITIGNSRSITGTYLSASASYDGTCDTHDPVSQERTICCMGQIPEKFSGMTLTDCARSYNTDCLNYYQDCLNSTSLPLGTPLLLLPFALVYALVRRKRNVVE